MTLLLCLLSAVVKVHSQTFPYVSFMGTNLTNHSYVNLTLVGRAQDGSDSVQCNTNLPTCCSSSEGDHCGNWYFPNETRLPFPFPQSGMYENCSSLQVNMGYTGNGGISGIYRCGIETTSEDGRKTVYAGLYICQWR